VLWAAAGVAGAAAVIVFIVEASGGTEDSSAPARIGPGGSTPLVRF
jgi:hypothetical protein